jgi:hypothetical protein
MRRIAALGIAVVAGLAALWFAGHRTRKPYVSYETIKVDTNEVRFILYHLAPTRDPQGPSGVYVPRDVEDAMRELDRMLPEEVIADMKTRVPIYDYHHSIGMWMRNNWGLWGGSRLQDYFMRQGIRHPDEMSGVILRAYRRHLRSLPPAPPMTDQQVFIELIARACGLLRTNDEAIFRFTEEATNSPVHTRLRP